MKILFLLLIINTFFYINNQETNFLKLSHCLQNSENVKSTGNDLLKDIKSSFFAAAFSIYTSIELTKDDYTTCEKKARDFEFDSICVLKCLHKFKIDYDYSCFGSCYY